MFDRREVRFNLKVQRRYGVELFHNIAGELKTYMAPTEQGADIVEEIEDVYDADKERLEIIVLGNI